MAAERDAASWDERYARQAWLTEPSSTVVAAVSGLAPGRAVDLAGGTGRHALWLARRGWQVTSVDFSSVGSAQGRSADADGLVTWVVADVREWAPPGQVDLVLVAYAQLGPAGLRRAGGWLSPGGRLVVVGHALRNLTDGVHGPRDPAHLQTEELLREGAQGLVVERLEEVLRPDEDGTVVELLLVARRADRRSTEQVRRQVVDGEVGHVQATLADGFRLDEAHPGPWAGLATSSTPPLRAAARTLWSCLRTTTAAGPATPASRCAGG